MKVTVVAIDVPWRDIVSFSAVRRGHQYLVWGRRECPAVRPHRQWRHRAMPPAPDAADWSETQAESALSAPAACRSQPTTIHHFAAITVIQPVQSLLFKSYSFICGI